MCRLSALHERTAALHVDIVAEPRAHRVFGVDRTLLVAVDAADLPTARGAVDTAVLGIGVRRALCEAPTTWSRSSEQSASRDHDWP